MHISLSQPDIRPEDREAVLQVLDSNSLSLGPKVPLFEEAAARVTGSEYAIAVNSGTSGLHLCVKAAGVTEGDEVITSPFSFVASANCILFEGAKPVFVDVDPFTYNLDPSRIEQAITDKTAAILPVHVFGRPCAISEISTIAESYGLTVIEDACEAIGATHRGRPVGSFGQTGVFAFYPNKQLTTGEGGVIVTNDRVVSESCRGWRNQGRSPGDGWLEHQTLGYNYRLSDIQCALGIAQLSRLEEVMEMRARVAKLYDERLRDVAEVIPPPIEQTDGTISWFVYVIQLRDEFSREDRDQIISSLRGQGVECKNYFPPIHLQPYYVERFGYRKGDFPITESISERTIALPFYNRLSETQVTYVCEALKTAIAELPSRRNRTTVAA